MLRITFVVALCVVGVANATPNDVAGKRAQLQILDTRPLLVRGVGFKPAERVRVLVETDPRSRSRTTRANLAGRLTVTFDVTVPYCGSFTLQAVGATGSRVPAQERVASAYPRRYYLDVECPPASGTRSTS
jgi:hypothetical protein